MPSPKSLLCTCSAEILSIPFSVSALTFCGSNPGTSAVISNSSGFSRTSTRMPGVCCKRPNCDPPYRPPNGVMVPGKPWRPPKGTTLCCIVLSSGLCQGASARLCQGGSAVRPQDQSSSSGTSLRPLMFIPVNSFSNSLIVSSNLRNIRRAKSDS